MLQQLPQICSQARGFPTTMPYLDKPNTYIIAIFFRAKNPSKRLDAHTYLHSFKASMHNSPIPQSRNIVSSHIYADS